MIESIYVLKSNIYFAWFAMLIFFGGFCFSYLAYLFNLSLLFVFPHWFIKTMSRYVNPRSSMHKIFMAIFLFNSISILIYMLSGVLIILPFIITFITGLNIGLTVFIPPQHNVDGYHIKELHGPLHAAKFVLFSTLVLILEVLVFSLALGMGMSLGIAINSIGGMASILIADLVFLRVIAYFAVCIPLLALSAYMEACVIKGI